MTEPNLYHPVTAGYLLARRIIVSFQYLLVLIAGIIAVVKPTPTVYSVVSAWVVYAWALFFLVGGAIALVGAVSGYRIGEIIGIPLIASASLVYGVAVIYQSTIQTARSVFVFIFVGVFAISYAVAMFDRFIDACNIIRISEETQERTTDTEGGDDVVSY